MATEVVECEFAALFRLYAGLLGAVGLQPDEAALAGHLADGAEEREQLEALMRSPEDEPAEGGAVPPSVADSLQSLEEALGSELYDAALKLGLDVPAGGQMLVQRLHELPEGEKDSLADAILSNGQAQFVRPRYMEAAAFRRAVSESHDPESLALVRLVPYLRAQLQERGYLLTDREITHFFDAACQSQVPYCLKSIMAGVNGQFSTGLIPLEEMVGDEDAGDWLERVRQRLLFRSHSAMHKAISEATSLKYDCVHKALSGNKKAKRIQAEIKYCLDQWLQKAEAGGDPPIDDDHRGVPVEWTCALLPRLEEAFESKEEIYRVISEKTGIKAGSVRRYFQSNGQLKCAPLTVYRLAKKLAAGTGSTVRRRPSSRASYLADQATLSTASKLAAQVNDALRRWQDGGADPDLELEYRHLRLSLIVAIKEQQAAVPEEA